MKHTKRFLALVLPVLTACNGQVEVLSSSNGPLAGAGAAAGASGAPGTAGNSGASSASAVAGASGVAGSSGEAGSSNKAEVGGSSQAGSAGHSAAGSKDSGHAGGTAGAGGGGVKGGSVDLASLNGCNWYDLMSASAAGLSGVVRFNNDGTTESLPLPPNNDGPPLTELTRVVLVSESYLIALGKSGDDQILFRLDLDSSGNPSSYSHIASSVGGLLDLNGDYAYPDGWYSQLFFSTYTPSGYVINRLRFDNKGKSETDLISNGNDTFNSLPLAIVFTRFINEDPDNYYKGYDAYVASAWQIRRIRQGKVTPQISISEQEGHITGVAFMDGRLYYAVLGPDNVQGWLHTVDVSESGFSETTPAQPVTEPGALSGYGGGEGSGGIALSTRDGLLGLRRGETQLHVLLAPPSSASNVRYVRPNHVQFGIYSGSLLSGYFVDVRCDNYAQENYKSVFYVDEDISGHQGTVFDREVYENMIFPSPHPPYPFSKLGPIPWANHDIPNGAEMHGNKFGIYRINP